jgi:riboflavin-specific deaminase-like protein
MDQIFPSPVDDVEPETLYAADERPPPRDRPWVMSNMISSVDGGIAIDGVSGGLGGPADKRIFSAVRAVPDVIVVASGTVIAENYRRPQTPDAIQEHRMARGQAALPRIAIVTRSLQIDPIHRVFDPEARPIVITTSDAPDDRRRALEPVADLMTAGTGSVDLTAALRQLRRSGANVVLLEGGPTLNGAFVDADLVDEVCLSFSPVVIGGNSPRIVNRSANTEPRRMRLDRTLHEDGFLFHRYLRER